MCSIRDVQWLPSAALDDRYIQTDRAEWAFRQHKAKIYRYLLRRTRDHHEAEELTQRVFVDAVAALSGSDPPPRSLLAWLYSVAERRLIDEVRRRARTESGSGSIADHHRSHHEDTPYGPAAARALRNSIQRLPPEQRDVVVMKVLEGRRFRDIARSLGTTEAACKMRFSRAIRRIRNDLEGEGLDP